MAARAGYRRAAARNHVFEATLALSGHARTYVATVEPGRVALRDASPSGSEDLCGELVPVVDSMAGRGAPLDAVLDGSPSAREPFTWLTSHLEPRS